MPLYLFRCPVCAYEHEYLLSVGAAEYHRPLCRKCAAELERVPAAANFTVKGYSAANGYAK